MDSPQHPDCLAAAQRLLEARRLEAPILDWPDALRPVSFEQAYVIQALQMTALGPIGGWKVGAAAPAAPPTCAPLPLCHRHAGPSRLPSDGLSERGVEVEIGVVMARDLPVEDGPYDARQVWSAVSQVCVAVEMVESRFAERDKVGRLSTLADLASHGALVYQSRGAPAGDPRLLDPAWVRLQVGGQPPLQGPSQNPAGDPMRLLLWLANQGSRHGGGLRQGQVVITGSCLPMLRAAPGDLIRASVDGLGELEFICG